MPSGRKHKKGGPREGSKAQMAQPDIRKNKKDLLKDEQLVPAALLEDDALAAEASDDEKHFEVDKRNLAELIDQFDSATSLKSTMEAIEDRVGACPLTCPISQIPINEMDDPVITSDGRVYEKRDILENMNKRGNINPMDGLPFKRNQPVPPNLLVRAAIIPGDNIDGIPAGPIPAENIRADLIPVGNIPTNLVPADFILGDLLAIHAQLQQSAREQFINIAEQMYTQQAAATQQASEQREKLKTAKAQMEQQQNETSLLKQQMQTALSESEAKQKRLQDHLVNLQEKTQAELTDLHTKKAKLEAAQTEKNKKIEELEKQNAARKRELTKLQARNEDLTDQNAKSENQLEESHALVDMYKELADVHANQAEEFRSENIKLQDENAALKAKLAQLETLLLERSSVKDSGNKPKEEEGVQEEKADLNFEVTKPTIMAISTKAKDEMRPRVKASNQSPAAENSESTPPASDNSVAAAASPTPHFPPLSASQLEIIELIQTELPKTAEADARELAYKLFYHREIVPDIIIHIKKHNLTVREHLDKSAAKERTMEVTHLNRSSKSAPESKEREGAANAPDLVRLPQEDAIKFIKTELKIRPKDAKTLAEKLGYLQPTMTIAVAYIKEFQLTVDKYLKKFNKIHVSSGMQKIAQTPGEKITASVLYLTVGDFERLKPGSFFSILGACIYLYPEISKPWLESEMATLQAIDAGFKPENIQLAINTLKNNGLLQIEENDLLIKINPTIQRLTHQILSPAKRKELIEATLSSLVAIINKNNGQAVDKKILRHLAVVVDYYYQGNFLNPNVDLLGPALWRLGLYHSQLDELGEKSKARRCFTHLLNVYKTHFGLDDKKLIKVLIALARNHDAPQELQQQLDFFSRALHIKEKYAGKNALELIPFLSEIVAVHMKMENLAAAENIINRANAIYSADKSPEKIKYLGEITKMRQALSQAQSSAAAQDAKEESHSIGGQADLLAVTGIGIFEAARTVAHTPPVTPKHGSVAQATSENSQHQKKSPEPESFFNIGALK